MKKTDEQRFWNKTNKNGPLVLESPCWIWIGAKDRYGRFWIEGKSIPSHRLSYEFHKGPIPKGFYVCHRCDIPRCINPEHLFLGTQQDNRRDCAEKKRTARGIKNGASKLSEKQILEIRSAPSDHGVYADLARKFNVSKSIISSVKNRKTWKHI